MPNTLREGENISSYPFVGHIIWYMGIQRNYFLVDRKAQ